MLKQLRDEVKELFENSSDEKVLKQYANVENSIAKVEEEQEEMMKRNTALQGSLKDAILHSKFKEDEIKPSDKPKPKSLEEIANEIIKEDNKK